MYFDATVHDFGTIPEDGGAIEYQFVFQNVGESPLKVDSVLASCGCTTPAWSSNAIPPGEFGFVTARYNPMNRPGDFNKYLTVFSNTDQGITQLLIKGNVTPRPRTIIDTLVAKVGGLRVQSQAFNFGIITNEKAITQEFDVYNDSTVAITFLDEMVKPDYVQVRFEPQRLKPKEKGKIIITYDPVAKNDYGYSFDNLILATDEIQKQKQFYVIATINDYFPPMTQEELDQAPKIKLAKNTHDFGEVKANGQYKTAFEFTNTGKQNLEIRAVKASCGCTATAPDKRLLAPGETGTINVTYSSYGQGMQQKIITIYSNDPTSSSMQVVLKANVIPEQVLVYL